ncbi:transporter substrate-binding domain-containing protein [Aeromonas australiensis]|uniref:ATP-binding protein n=1 Tax=Aeromonas australiensis TaxID=1114880 RepID=UPI001F302C30|nr:transporter substrate-binding domain-containing protein [Aeromonas australiensis]MCF3099282.1 transporter substrate-binding domain-containing protein [Aeromonas australiensis]
MSLVRQLFLLLLLFSGMSAVAVPRPQEEMGGNQSTTDKELVIGVPRGGYPPFLYELPNQRYAGPLKELASRIAAEMGVSLRYISYNSYVDAQIALQGGQIDALIGVERNALEAKGITHIGSIGSYIRSILMHTPDQRLTLERARKLRWVCIRGFGSCNELARLGISDVTELDSRSEASYMVKQGAVDAYLEMGPIVTHKMARMPSSMGVVIPKWLSGSMLTMVTSSRQPELSEKLWQAYQRIPVADSRLRLHQEDERANAGLLLEPDEASWLQQKNKVIKFAVAPGFAGISEIDDEGELHGYTADLMKLLSMRSGIRFELESTNTWQESLQLLKQHKVDLIPLMTPLNDRQSFASFTSSYLQFDSYVVARRGARALTSLAELKGRLIGGVIGSYEASLIQAHGGHIIEVGKDTELLTLLDTGEAEYVLLTMTNLGQQAMKGFNEKYQVVLSSPEFSVPISMGVDIRQPELLRIMDKLLLTITDEEWQLLERRWLNVSVNIESDYSQFYKWLVLGGAALLTCGLLVMLWARSLRRQIAQRKIAEDKLNEQLLFVQTLLNSLPTMVALRDSEQRITLCNQAYRDAFLGAGSCSEELQNMPETLRNSVLEEERRVWQTGQDLEGAGSNLRADGTPCHVIYAKRPYRDPDGNMRGVLTVLTDVSRIKDAEERARQAETRLTQITDSMPGVVYQYLWQGPGKGRFLYASKGANEILGVTHQELFSAESAGEVFGFTEQALQEFVSKVANHAETLVPLDLEVKLERPDGDRYLQVRGNFVRQKQQALILNGVIQDITSLKQQEYELRKARAYAEQAMQARSRFLATMSHELRTPISGMHGMLELLQMSELNDDQRFMVRNVVNSTNNLLYLVNDILDFSKIEAGQLQLNYQCCRLQTVICDAIRGHAALAHSKGLKVGLEWGQHVPDWGDIDGVRVGQVISNLLNNAVKFTEQGEVSIKVSYLRDQLAISIRDTGIGIAEEKQELLFTPFEQVESDINRRFGGTGLGLAICDQLVCKMGGVLTLTSKAGEGSHFCFTLPLANPQWDEPPLAGTEWWFFSADTNLEAAMLRLGARLRHLDASQLNRSQEGLLLADQQRLEQALGGEWQSWLQHVPLRGIIMSPTEALRGRIGGHLWWRQGLSPLYPDLLLESCLELLQERAAPVLPAVVDKLGGRVLVADDHPVNRVLLARQLAILGIEAQVVEDGEKALRAWQGQQFSLLLTDCHMPVMDGYALTKALRAAGVTAPIIGVTADISEEASARMIEVGMSDMLLKPYPLDTLRQLLAHWLVERAPARGAVVSVDRAPVTQAERWLTLFGDELTARAMAAEYLDSNRQDGVHMISALACHDFGALVETAHRIKGAARMVGLQELASQAARLESAARLKQLEELDELTSKVQLLMTAIAHDMGLWLDEKSTT